MKRRALMPAVEIHADAAGYRVFAGGLAATLHTRKFLKKP
jgi:hypothetical protein